LGHVRVAIERFEAQVRHRVLEALDGDAHVAEQSAEGGVFRRELDRLGEALFRLLRLSSRLVEPSEQRVPLGPLAVDLDRAREVLAGRVAIAELEAGATEILERLSEIRSEEHTSELQSRENLVCRLLLEKKKEPD